ncbi:MAG: hypothetical protein KY464_15870 [Gemmatimonadetes bacterium]|nr:hypothetical protein [Gemmatimonadota bacterium]
MAELHGAHSRIIDDVQIQAYVAVLKEECRQPSNGGNENSLHQHRMKVDGKWYSWPPGGSKKWVFPTDRVSFRYIVTPEGYRHVLTETLETVDKHGNTVVRGDRSPVQ